MREFIFYFHWKRYLKRILSNRFRVDWPTDKLLRERFGQDMPSVIDLKKNTSLLMINTHYALSGVRPNVPAIVEIGGIHVKKPKKLSKVFELIHNYYKYRMKCCLIKLAYIDNWNGT